jgi:protein-S-isoprenylcysteine O-methyltransferase Ste14
MWSTVLTGVAFGAVAGGAILDLADVLVPDDVLDATAGHAAGIALWVFGAGLARTAQLTMGSSWRMGVDETERLELITSGPFRVVRNPIYTGLFAMFAGWALLVPNWVSLAALPLAIAGFELLVRRVEEPYIHRLHGEPFGRWASATGRFVPGVGRVAATPGDAEQAP